MSNDLDIHYEPFDALTVEAVDRIVEIAKKNGSQDYIQTEADWRTVETIYKVFSIMYPETNKDFEKAVKSFRDKSNTHGIGKDGEGLVQHTLEVPQPFYQMMKTIFPLQEWDRKFCLKMAQKLPQLKPIKDSY